MRTTRTVPVPATTHTLTTVSCDFCGKSCSEGSDNWPDKNETDSEHVIRKTTLEYVAGESYPEYTSTTTTSLDMCPECWNTKFLVWCAAHNVKPRKTETEY